MNESNDSCPALDRLEFLELFREQVLASWDPYRDYLVRYGPNLYFKHELACLLNPTWIVEIGVRTGYSMWAMMVSCMNTHYYGIDCWEPVEGVPEESAVMQERYFEYAGKLAALVGSHQINFKMGDSQAESFSVPHADLYHIDGAHGTGPCYTDIVHCLQAANEGALIVVHDYNDPSIRSAVTNAVRDHGLEMTYVCSEWGDAILSKEEPPAWVADLKHRWREWWDPHSLGLVQAAWLHKDLFDKGMEDRPLEPEVDSEAQTQELPAAVEEGESNA